jgi:hypothetical protein
MICNLKTKIDIGFNLFVAFMSFASWFYVVITCRTHLGVIASLSGIFSLFGELKCPCLVV